MEDSLMNLNGEKVNGVLARAVSVEGWEDKSED